MFFKAKCRKIGKTKYANKISYRMTENKDNKNKKYKQKQIACNSEKHILAHAQIFFIDDGTKQKFKWKKIKSYCNFFH